jgi:tRNA-binding protein
MVLELGFMKVFQVSPVKPLVPSDVLERIDVRVGTIESVEDIEGSDKLVKLVVDFGDRKRNILVGMKHERDNPKEIEGRQALFVVNVEPKRMMGEVSEGMVFDIGYADGIAPVLAMPEKPVPNGARAG